MIKFGTFLFRWRDVIGFIAFGLIWLLARPNWLSIWISLPVIFIGLFFRFWANGYMNKEGRSNEIMAKSLITQGPYRFIRNPLYLGNFFLTLAVLIGSNPPIYLTFLITFLFWVEYSMIINAEQDFLTKQYGEKYLSYCKTTGAIIPKGLFSELRRKPFIKSLRIKSNPKLLLRNAISELQTIIILLIIYALIYLRMGRKF